MPADTARITPNVLEAIGDEIRDALLTSNFVKSSPKSATKRKSTSDLASPPPTKRINAAPKVTPHMSTQSQVPAALKLDSLRKLYQEDNMKELASLKYTLFLTHKYRDENGKNEIKIDGVQNILWIARVDLPSTIPLDELFHLDSKRVCPAAWTNVRLARDEVFARIPTGMFRPKDDELLHQWMKNGEQYTSGSRPPPSNYEDISKTRGVSLSIMWCRNR